MKDDSNFETNLACCPDLRISELSETCKTFSHSDEQVPKSSSSEPNDDIVQEMSHANGDVFANTSSNAVFQKAESENFKEDDEEQDKNVIYGVVQQELGGRDKKLEISGGTATCLNDIAVVKQKKGYEGEETVKMAGSPATCFDDTVFQKQEWAPAGFNHSVLEIQESEELVDVEAAILSKQELKLNEVNDGVSENSEMGVAGVEEKLKLDEKMEGNTYNPEGSVKCALKIEVIDETALVNTPVFGRVFGKEGKHVNLPENSRENVNNKTNEGRETGGNKEKRPRRRGKGGKKKNSGVDEKSKNLADVGLSPNSEIGNFQGSDNEKGEKKVYMRKELEALRFVGIEGQKKKWVEVYCGLGPAVQKEYDGLMDSGNCNQYHQKHIHMNFNPRNEAPPSTLGEESSENADDDITYKNPTDATSNLLPDIDEKGSLIGQGDCIDDDSDEDYSSIQKPVFLVTGEPDFDAGPPDDGLEYLRRVRWEATQIPKVKVAKVDRSKLNKEQTIYMPQIPDVAKCPVHLMPLKEWEDAFLADFSELRLALSRYEVSETICQSSASVHKGESSRLFDTMLLENLDNMAATEDSCQSVSCTISETCGNPGYSSVANENSDSIESPSSKLLASGVSEKYPTLSMILRMDSVARVSMLRKRTSMAASMSKLSWADCLWLFALSAAVDCPLDADNCAAFRSLLRKCASLRAEKLELDEEVAMLNILATISGRYFGQLEK